MDSESLHRFKRLQNRTNEYNTTKNVRNIFPFHEERRETPSKYTALCLLS